MIIFDKHHLYLNLNLFRHFFAKDIRENYELTPSTFLMMSKNILQKLRDINYTENLSFSVFLVYSYLGECITNRKDPTTGKYYGTNVVFPSFEKISEVTKISRRTAIYAMNKLCKHKLIYKFPAIFSASVHTNKKHKSNLYYVCGAFDNLEKEQFVIEQFIKRMRSLQRSIQKDTPLYRDFMTENDPLFFYLLFSLKNRKISKEKMTELKARVEKFYPNLMKKINKIVFSDEDLESFKQEEEDEVIDLL